MKNIFNIKPKYIMRNQNIFNKRPKYNLNLAYYEELGVNKNIYENYVRFSLFKYNYIYEKINKVWCS